MTENIFLSSSKVSGNLGNFQKMFANICVAFGQISKNLQKSSENHQKHCYQYVCAINKIIHVCLWIWNISSCVELTVPITPKIVFHLVKSLY